MKKSLIILLAATVALSACNREKKGPGGTMYTIHHSGGNEKIKEGDIVKLNFVQKTEKDTVLSSTYENGMFQAFPVQPKTYPGDIQNILTLFGEGDSVTFKLNLDTLAFYTKQPRAEQFKNDKYFIFTVKVEKVFKKNAGEADTTFQKRVGAILQADQKVLMDKRKAAEPGLIKAYIADNKLNTKTTVSGLQYVINAPGDAERAMPGDTVMVNYTGRFISKGTDGKYKAFDTNNRKVAMETKGLAQPGRSYEPVKMVIGAIFPGVNEGLQMIGKGGKITLVMPSKLALGEQGGGPFAPYTPVTFEVELVNIIKGKGPLPVPAAPMAAPVKP